MAKMNRAALLGGATLPLFVLMGACSMDTGEQRSGPLLAPGVHLMPLHPPASEPINEDFINTAAPPGSHLNYYGGPMLTAVKVWVVFWGSNVDNQSTINAFYGTITKSPYFDWLSEYNLPSQAIGHGSLAGSIIDPAPPAGGAISDSQIQAEITKLIDGGKLPQNDENTLYMVHFPPGVTISTQGSHSCAQFCAYHSTFTHGGKSAYYGVMPDVGQCGQGCGGGTKVDNTTEIASHELIEAVTDPEIGLVVGASPPLAWYDLKHGEIGDICVGMKATVSGFAVQKEFSNELHDCIATKPGGGGAGGGGSSSSASSSSSSSSASSSSSSSSSSGGGGNCAHSLCTPGVRLKPYCDPCVTQVCIHDGHCCGYVWDASCVNEVGLFCGQPCP